MNSIVPALSSIVFAFLDFLDLILCFFYKFADSLLEETSLPCYCHHENSAENRVRDAIDEEDEVSETLNRRENRFRAFLIRIQKMGFLKMREKERNEEAGGALMRPRWSDCHCEACVSWLGKEKQLLHVAVREPAPGPKGNKVEDVILIHGILSSSLIFTETVFHNLSDNADGKFRLFAPDLLGFGRSPKPFESLYRLKDHLGKIEDSVIKPFGIESFHLVAHSMGSIIALALAAKYPNAVKSITIIGPPYFPTSSMEKASFTALIGLAERRIWPLLLFWSSVMSWYEHLGRTVCFIICKHHRFWAWIIKLFTFNRGMHFIISDLTKHTHHSAWHNMHNVICGGAKYMDNYLETVKRSGCPLKILLGGNDHLVPMKCGFQIKQKVPSAEVEVIPNADHCTVILKREREFTRDLEHFWAFAST
ncbi:hypothetical protein AMTRI_Chr01g102430 [Amborella trichopoda]